MLQRRGPEPYREPALSRNRDYHRRNNAGISNWQSWHNAGVAAVGFCLQDDKIALRQENGAMIVSIVRAGTQETLMLADSAGTTRTVAGVTTTARCCLVVSGEDGKKTVHEVQ